MEMWMILYSEDSKPYLPLPFDTEAKATTELSRLLRNYPQNSIWRQKLCVRKVDHVVVRKKGVQSAQSEKAIIRKKLRRQEAAISKKSNRKEGESRIYSSASCPKEASPQESFFHSHAFDE